MTAGRYLKIQFSFFPKNEGKQKMSNEVIDMKITIEIISTKILLPPVNKSAMWSNQHVGNNIAPNNTEGKRAPEI